MIHAYPHHPFAEIFPFRDGPTLTDLADSIAEYGQFEDIVLHEGQVLEGRRRQAGCIARGIAPRYRKFGSRPGDGDDALEFAFRVNFDRRSMTEPERVLAARQYANLKKGRRSSNATNVAFEEKPISQKEAAEKFDVTVKQIQRANNVMEKGIPELQAAVKEQEVSISDAASIADEEPDVQKKAIAAVQAGEAKTLKEAVASGKPAPPEDVKKLGLDLEHLIERLGRVETKETAARTLAVQGLKAARALIAKLGTVLTSRW